MNKKERVATAISHQVPDRTPKGDLAIESQLLQGLIGQEKFNDLSENERIFSGLEILDADLVHIHQLPMEQVGTSNDGQPIFRSVFGDEHIFTENSSCLHRPALDDIECAKKYGIQEPSTCVTKNLDWFVENSDLFVSAQIMGPVSSLDWMLGTEDYMVFSMTNTADIKYVTEKVIDYEIFRAKQFIDHGADSIVVADDIAFNTGLFLPPQIMDELVWPFYRRILREVKQHKNVPVFLHTDGDIRKAIGDIVGCGFDGLHSLQPSAGMDIKKVKEDYGDKICLMGNMDLDRLMTFGTPEDVKKQAKWLCENIGFNGGYILSTCNILIDAIPPENAMAMYHF